jgi:putative lipoprotein
MLRGSVLLFLLAGVAFRGLLSGQANATQNAVTGTVTYRQSVELPLDAAIAVRLEDVSPADSRARVLSESIISTAGHSVPIPFQLLYDPGEINPSHTYQVRATITANGTLLLTSSTAYRVLTQGAPSKVAIMLHETDATATLPHSSTRVAPRSMTALEETKWKLIRLGGDAVVPATEGAEVQIVLHKGQNKLTGSGGCKQIEGTYVLAQSSLRFSLSDTLTMVCGPEVIRQEKVFFNALGAVRSYRIVADRLELLLGSEVLAVFRAEKK